jgi:hypothetical protein
MDRFQTKIIWSFGFFIRLVFELAHDLWAYYASPYPFMLDLQAACAGSRLSCRPNSLLSAETSGHDLKELLNSERYFSLLIWMNISDFFDKRGERQGVWGAHPAMADWFMQTRLMVFTTRNLNTTAGSVTESLDRETNNAPGTCSDQRPW